MATWSAPPTFGVPHLADWSGAATDGAVRLAAVLVLAGVLLVVGVRQARRRGATGTDRYTARP